MLLPSTASVEDVYRIIFTDHHDPFTVLGIHIIKKDDKDVVAIRAFLPDAKEAFVIEVEGDSEEKEYPMGKIHEDGFFELLLG